MSRYLLVILFILTMLFIKLKDQMVFVDKKNNESEKEIGNSFILVSNDDKVIQIDLNKMTSKPKY